MSCRASYGVRRRVLGRGAGKFFTPTATGWAYRGVGVLLCLGSCAAGWLASTECFAVCRLCRWGQGVVQVVPLAKITGLLCIFVAID